MNFRRKRGNLITPYIIPMKPVLDLIGEWESIFSFPSEYYSLKTNTHYNYFLKKRIF
jgi:hypothetical protein